MDPMDYYNYKRYRNRNNAPVVIAIVFGIIMWIAIIGFVIHVVHKVKEISADPEAYRVEHEASIVSKYITSGNNYSYDSSSSDDNTDKSSDNANNSDGNNNTVNSNNGTDAQNNVKYIGISATNLFSLYHENEIRADRYFKGKRLAITGTISNIGKNFWDRNTIDLKTGNVFYVIYCGGLSDDEIENLYKGEKIGVVGVCSGKFLDLINMDNCSLVPVDNITVKSFHF